MPLNIKGRKVVKQKGKSKSNKLNRKDWKADSRLKSERSCDTPTEVSVDLTNPKPCSESDAYTASLSSRDTCMQSPVPTKGQNSISPVKNVSLKYQSLGKKIKAAQISKRFQKASKIFTKAAGFGNTGGKGLVANGKQGNEFRRANSPLDNGCLNEKGKTNPLGQIYLNRTGKKEKEDRSITESSLQQNEVTKKIQVMKDQLNELEQTVKSHCNVGASVSKRGNEVDGIGSQLPNKFQPTQCLNKGTEQSNNPNEDVSNLILDKEESLKPLVDEVTNGTRDDNCIDTQANVDEQELNILLNMQLMMSGDKCNAAQERVTYFLEQLRILLENDLNENPDELSQHLASNTTEEEPSVSTTNILQTSRTTPQKAQTLGFDNNYRKEVMLLLEEIISILETLKRCQVEKQNGNLAQNVKSTPRLRSLIAQLKSAIRSFNPNPSMSETSDVLGELRYLIDVLGGILQNGCINQENLVKTGQILCYIDDEFQQQGNLSYPLDANIRNVMEIIKTKLVHPPSSLQ
ncbi:unnamed protein product [Rodentolepis nana]|uniref:PCM1_C domain-containing protein n=1 Tax=Rodentolepis nana TaxID=102285 RepID=A0A0R3TJB6_RODNA|nr:unnamed protein product [Rodentolepis nana]